MAYDYFGSSIFHSFVRMLNDGEMVTHETLYKLGLKPIIDRTTWLLDEIHRVRADLSSTASGTRATIIGTRDLSTLTLYDAETNPRGELGAGGLLDGKSLILQEDTYSAEEVRFVAPNSAAELVTQIVQNAPRNKAVLLDGSSRLVLMSCTEGENSTLRVDGSAVGILGLPIGMATGSSAVSDGASLIGFAAHPAANFPAGNLRSTITYLIDNVTTHYSTKADRAGDTFTGPVTFNDNVTFNGAMNDGEWDTLPDADKTVEAATANLLLVPPVTALRTYRLAEPGSGRWRIRFVRPTTSTHAVYVRRFNGTLITSLMPPGPSWVEFWYVGGAWRVVGWGGNASNLYW